MEKKVREREARVKEMGRTKRNEVRKEGEEECKGMRCVELEMKNGIALFSLFLSFVLLSFVDSVPLHLSLLLSFKPSFPFLLKVIPFFFSFFFPVFMA